jgi:hypothetical protein
MGSMHRKEMLRQLLNQAQSNGFDFRSWYQFHIRPDWPGDESALDHLSIEGRHYTLLFAHDFAQSFWRTGAQMSFMIPAATYPRVTARGEVMQVTRKPFTRRTIKADVWKYHLRMMAASEDPIAYLTRFLPRQDHEFARATPLPAALAAQA